MFRSRASKKAFRKKDEQELQSDEIQIFATVQKKRAPVNKTGKPSVQSSSYNPEILAGLKREQVVKYNIPNDEQIQIAKDLREGKRNTSKTVEAEFVALDENVVSTVGKKESRQFIEDLQSEEDDFEDYNGKELAFGSQAVLDAKAKAIKDKEVLFNQSESEEDDEQCMRWEMEKLQNGQRILTAVAQQLSPTKRTRIPSSNLNLQVPDIPAFPSGTEIVEILQKRVKLASDCVDLHQLNLTSLQKDLEDSQHGLVKSENDIKEASRRFDFYQELKLYTQELSEFITTKQNEIGEFSELVLGERRKILQLSITKRFNAFASDFAFMSTNIVAAVLDESMEELIEETIILEERNNIFRDKQHIFSSHHESIKQFEKWKLTHPQDFKDSYGNEAVAPALDLYVRYELSMWEPLSSTSRLDELEWHEDLLYFGHQEEEMDAPDINLLKVVVEKSVVPVFQRHLENSFDVWDPLHNANCFRVLNELREYISLRSNAMQNILDTIEELIDKSVTQLLAAFPIPLLRGVDDKNLIYKEQKQRSLGQMLSFMETLLGWKRFFPKAIIHNWIVKQLLEPVCTALECSRNTEQDLVLYNRVHFVNLVI